MQIFQKKFSGRRMKEVTSKKEYDEMDNKEWIKLIHDRRVAVSDTLAFTHSEASNSCFSPDRGVFYTVYTASRRNYGESHDVLAFNITPVCQPHRSITKVITEIGVDFSLKDAQKILCPNCFYYTTDEVLYNAKTHFGKTADIYRGYVRITIEVDGKKHYYLDYDIINDTFSELKPLRVLFHGETVHLTGDVFKAYLEENGCPDYHAREHDEFLILSDKFKLHTDGYRYILATASWAWPAMMRMKDGSDIMEFVGVIPHSAQYEAQSAILNGRIYALLRGAEENDFWVSDDMGKSFRSVGRVDFNTTRPQLFTYKDQIYIAVSKKGVEPNYVRDGRNNLLLLRGEGDDLSKYEQVFHVSDPYGMVYYDILEYKGRLFMFWSSADLYVDKNPQAKDLLWFVSLGEI